MQGTMPPRRLAFFGASYGAPVALCLLLIVALAGCDRGVKIDTRTVEAACAMCAYELEGAKGCYWAVVLEGKPVPATGPAIPTDHASHAPDGMCNIRRRVVVEGELSDGLFYATRFELLPPQDVPAQPRFSDADSH